jgi:uncharacterized protein (DUF1501 family)
MQRRNFLRAAAGLSLAGMQMRLWAAPRPGSKFLLIFLRGGLDTNHLLVPIASDFYYRARPNIAIARPGTAPDCALGLTADWGLHPVFKETLFPIWQANQLAFIPFAGTEDTSRSHFETQDSIELGQPLAGERDFQSGFLNRLAQKVAAARPISFTDQVPLSLRGSREVANIALKSVGKPAVDARQAALIAGMYEGTHLAAAVNDGFGVREEVMRKLTHEMSDSSRGAVAAKGFEAEAQRIGRLMIDQFDIGFLDIGGWDTHVGQGAASGYLATHLDELGRGLRALADAMQPRWNDTVILVISEFGRTFRENGNRGTDHGHGTAYLALGGAVRGGRILGEQRRIEEQSLFENRDLPVLNNYRALMGGLFGRLFDLRADELAAVFPAAIPADLGIA